MISEVIRVFTMAVMLFNMCNQSDFNRKACMSDWDVWLYPELQRAWETKFPENSMSKKNTTFYLYKQKV